MTVLPVDVIIQAPKIRGVKKLSSTKEGLINQDFVSVDLSREKSRFSTSA